MSSKNDTSSSIFHFKTRLRKKDTNNLTRENYCIPKKELDYKYKKNIKLALEFIEVNKRPPLLCPPCYYEIPNKIFEDAEHFTDEFVKKHYKDCMENFDLNMAFFEKLDYEEFNNYLAKFIKKNKFLEVEDLKIVEGKSGIYILVLDKYKQVYIGKSESNIKGRILKHWSNRKDFGHLLHGTVDRSILSIDSFGALDTTRIFYKGIGWYEINEKEEELVQAFDSKYRLNRVAGGINGEEDSRIRNVMLSASIQKRELT